MQRMQIEIDALRQEQNANAGLCRVFNGSTQTAIPGFRSVLREVQKVFDSRFITGSVLLQVCVLSPSHPLAPPPLTPTPLSPLPYPLLPPHPQWSKY